MDSINNNTTDAADTIHKTAIICQANIYTITDNTDATFKTINITATLQNVFFI